MTGGRAWRVLRWALLLSLLTVVGMIVLLVPTMIWVRLRVPGAARLVEFLCLLPLTIPALVIVVGIRNVYAWVYYLVVTAPAASVMRRTITAVCGVLAQFGGVTLAFAWMATLGFGGLLTNLLADAFGLDATGSGWLYRLPGLILVYTYFQIPLMVIVFLPALEGLRPQWREAAVGLGATTTQYWTQVAFPLLRPAFLGSALLLFANAFAAYATAAALVSQGAPITPLLIRSALTSEVVLGQANFGYALALEMIVVVAIVMGLYAWLLKRTSRWLS